MLSSGGEKRSQLLLMRSKRAPQMLRKQICMSDCLHHKYLTFVCQNGLEMAGIRCQTVRNMFSYPRGLQKHQIQLFLCCVHLGLRFPLRAGQAL